MCKIKGLISILSLLTISLSMSCTESVSVPEEKTREQKWEEDIDFIIETLPGVHANLNRNIPENELLHLFSLIKNDLLYKSDEEILIELSRVLAKVEDGNTFLEPFFPFAELPVKMGWFSDGLFIRETTNSYNYLFGKRVLSIGSKPPDSLLYTFSQLVSADNIYGRKSATENYLHLPKFLENSGFSDRYDHAYFITDGNRRTEIIQEEVPQYYSILTDERLSLPWYQKNLSDPVWFGEFAEHQILYIQINESSADSSLYSEFYNSLALYTPLVRTEKIIFDLRFLSSCNNNFSLEKLFESLSQYMGENTLLYSIIGNKTKNYGASICYLLKTEYSALIVGSPTGSRLNHSAETGNIELPHFQHKIYYPEKIILNLPVGEEAIVPDIEVEISSEHYFSLSDPVFDYIKEM